MERQITTKSENPKTEERIKNRRERNKKAAAKCRQRKVDLTNQLMNKLEELTATHTQLTIEVEQMEKMKTDLTIALNKHLVSCIFPNLVISSSNVTGASCSKINISDNTDYRYSANSPQITPVERPSVIVERPSVIQPNLYANPGSRFFRFSAPTRNDTCDCELSEQSQTKNSSAKPYTT